jgi:hypothetical protein
MNVFRAVLSRDFWITGGAIARCLPQGFRTKQIDGNLLFTEQKRQEYCRRIESLTPGSQRQWGTMEVDQSTISTMHAEVRKASTIFRTRVI